MYHIKVFEVFLHSVTSKSIAYARNSTTANHPEYLTEMNQSARKTLQH